MWVEGHYSCVCISSGWMEVGSRHLERPSKHRSLDRDAKAKAREGQIEVGEK